MDFETSDGQRLRIRPVRPDDKTAISEAFQRSSERTRYLRFFAPLHHLTTPMLVAMTEVDGVDRFAFVALVCENDHESLIGVARYVRFRDEPQTAEMSIVVVDDYQGHGIGRLLLDALVLEANAGGITRFTGEVLADNKGIRRLLDDCGARFAFSGHGTFSMTLELAPYVAELRDAPMYGRLQDLVTESAAQPDRPSG